LLQADLGFHRMHKRGLLPRVMEQTPQAGNDIDVPEGGRKVIGHAVPETLDDLVGPALLAYHDDRQVRPSPGNARNDRAYLGAVQAGGYKEEYVSLINEAVIGNAERGSGTVFMGDGWFEEVDVDFSGVRKDVPQIDPKDS
jgi:hypothetical protein